MGYPGRDASRKPDASVKNSGEVSGLKRVIKRSSASSI